MSRIATLVDRTIKGSLQERAEKQLRNEMVVDGACSAADGGTAAGAADR